MQVRYLCCILAVDIDMRAMEIWSNLADLEWETFGLRELQEKMLIIDLPIPRLNLTNKKDRKIFCSTKKFVQNFFSVLQEKICLLEISFIQIQKTGFFSVFADGRIKSWAQSYQPKIPEKFSVFCTDFHIS